MNAGRAILLCAALALGACGGSSTGPDPAHDPVRNFDALWTEFDRTYSHFESKGIDWDAAYAAYGPQVTSETTGAQLFQIMSNMLDILKDGHIGLTTPDNRRYHYSQSQGYPANYNRQIVEQNYLTGGITRLAANTITFGKLAGDLGYIYVATLRQEAWASSDIDLALDGIRQTDGLVLDIRDNGGGSDSKGEYIASRFCDQRRLYRYFQFRDGPNHSDFTELTSDYIDPSEKWRYTGPVALLTNKRCFSAAESFVLAMSALPHVTVLGGVTAGGTGNPVSKTLPNGWTCTIPRWRVLTPDKVIFEGVGLAPDVTVGITDEDTAAGRDTILDRAIELLSQGE